MRKLVLAVTLFLALTSTASIAVAQVNPAAVVEQYIEATDRDDLDAALALFADDAVLQVQGQRQGGHLCDDTPCIGKDAIRREHERRQGIHDLELVDTRVAGNVVTAVLEIRSRRTQASGVDRAIHTRVFEVRDGKIALLEEDVAGDDPQTAMHRQVQQTSRGRSGAVPTQLPRTGDAASTEPQPAALAVTLLGAVLVASGLVTRRLSRAERSARSSQ